MLAFDLLVLVALGLLSVQVTSSCYGEGMYVYYLHVCKNIIKLKC